MFSDLNNPIDGGMASGSELPSNLRSNLKTAGTWGRFVAIIGFAFMGIGLLSLLIVGGTTESAMLGLGPSMGIFSTVFIGIYVGFIILSLYLNYLLFQFSRYAIVAANGNDIQAISDAMGAMAKFWKIIGIIIALYLAFVVVIMFGGILGGL